LYRGQEYLAINALQPALDDFEKALHLDPKSADAFLGRSLVNVKLGDLRQGVVDANKAVEGKPKEPHLWQGAARVFVQAAAQLKAEPSQEASQARMRARYQERAVVLLRTALSLVPADQRQAYWREQVMKDAVLYPIRSRLV